MKKADLKKLSLEEVVELAVKQEEKIAEIRGYESGLNKESLTTLGKKVLINCYLENQKTFHL